VPRAKVTTYETRVIPVYKFAIWGVTVTTVKPFKITPRGK